MIIASMFRRRWLLLTFIAFVAAVVMARLGIWQLDRLHQKRSFISHVKYQLDQPAYVLDEDTIQNDFTDMEYRSVIVRGIFEPEKNALLINQVYRGEYGAHLLSVLKVENTDNFIIIDQGWLPADVIQTGIKDSYIERGLVEVIGAFRMGQENQGLGSSFNNSTSSQDDLPTLLFVDIERLSTYVSRPLLPVYIQRAPDPGRKELPYRTEPDLELNEGPHLGYALQWFTFALIIVAGYPVYIHREESRK